MARTTNNQESNTKAAFVILDHDENLSQRLGSLATEQKKRASINNLKPLLSSENQMTKSV